MSRRSARHRHRRMRGMRHTIIAATLTLPAAIAAAQAGYDDLVERIGPDQVPTGAEVVVSQIEAPNANDNYRPNPNHAEFDGKTFTIMSGATGNSGHATNVGLNFYGLVTSIAPGIPSIYVWEVNDWLFSELRISTSNGTQPTLTPAGIKIANHSWIANAGTLNNDALRRADFVVSRDDVLFVVGVNNEEPHWPLMSHMFNGISVGLLDGSHASGPTLGGVDVPGRMKPEIVAPGNVTSFSTPVVGAAAALLVETARTDPDLVSNPFAERAEVLKAALLAGADHDATWTNNPAEKGPDRGVTSQPIDPVVGAGAVNINRSHLILTGGQQNGEEAIPAADSISHAGWDLDGLLPGTSRYWRFTLSETADEVSILTTWNRVILPSNMSNWNLPHFDLHLLRIDDSGNAAPLTGEENAAYFASGNVVSQSTLDNLEHVYVRGLVAGEYVIELRRIDPVPVARDVAIAWLLPEPTKIVGDLNGDQVVNIFDLLILLGAWGDCADPGDCPADLNSDGVVNIFDLLNLLGNWG